MAFSGHYLYYRKGGAVGIPLYTTTSDFYNYNGLSVRVGGSVFYAPLGSVGDMFGTDLHIKKNGSIYIATNQVIPPNQGTTQGGWSTGGGGTYYQDWNIYYNYFNVPNTRNVHITSVLNGDNESSTSPNWCWSRWHVYLDDSDISGELYRTSDANGGFSWTAVNGNYSLSAGQHNLRLYCYAHASNGDYQSQSVNSWVNTINV